MAVDSGMSRLQRDILNLEDWATEVVTRPEKPSTYDLYDSEGKKIGTGQRTSAEQSFAGQTVVTDPKTGRTYLSSEEDFDRIIDKIASSSTPKIEINSKKNGLVISGSDSALQYAKNSKLKDYLAKTFQYADFANSNVADMVEKLNSDLLQQNKQYLVENAIGGNYDDYKEYQLLLQTMKTNNPLKTETKVKGYDKNGKPQKWTVQQWIDYYRKEYSKPERQKLFQESYAKYNRDKDFTSWTPYIIMSGGWGGTKNEYGFTDAERNSMLLESLFYNSAGKLIEGAGHIAGQIANPFSWGGYLRKNNLNDIAHELGHKTDVALNEAKWMSEDAFNKKLDSIAGKNVNELSSDEQAFLAVALSDKLWGGPVGLGRDTKAFITEEGNDTISREQLDKATSYQDYINARDNLSTTIKYSEEVRKGAEAPFKGIKEDIEWGAEYAPFQTGFGTFAGTMVRMWVESGLISGLTGGISPMNISDEFADGLVGLMKAKGLETTAENLNTGIGKFMLLVAAEIPEDIIQSAIDDVVTGHPEYVQSLITPQSIEDNAIQNLIMRLAFTPAHAGLKWLKDREAVKGALKAAKLNQASEKVASWFTNARKVEQAADDIPGAGSIIDATENSATIRRPDGTTEVLDNVAMLHFADERAKERYPGIYEILRKKGIVEELTDADQDLTQRIADAKKSTEGILYPGEMKVVDLTDTDTFRFTDYDDWAYARKQYVDELVDLGDNRPRSAIEAEFEEKNQAPKKIESEVPDAEKPVTIYRTEVDADLAAKIPEDARGDVTVFSVDQPKIYGGTHVVAMDVAPNKILTSDMVAKIFKETSDIVERGGDVLDDYASTHGVDTNTVMRASVGDPEALAKISGRPVVEGSGFVNGLDDGQYGYFVSVDKDFDAGIAKTGLAATDGAASTADAASVELANKAQKALDGQPYDDDIKDIVANKYKAGNLDAVPDSSSYKWQSPDVTKYYSSDEQVFADMPVGKNMTEVRQWVKNASAYFMNKYVETTAPEFSKAYPTTDEQWQFVRNMDYLFDLQRLDGETLESAVGKTFENEGVTYTVKQEDIDFYQSVIEPIMAPLREAGAAGLGKDAFTITGYLPHSDYDPELLTAEDSLQQGVLWREYQGKSTTDEAGNFSTGWLDPELQARYQTFVHNMLWDSLGDNVVIAKYMEEFNADGLNVSANTVEKMVGGRRRLAHLVSESDSVKSVINHLLKDGEMPSDEAFEQAAKELGATDVVHQLYAPIYGSSDSVFQDKSSTSVKLSSKSDWMRTLGTGDGSLYDNGGAMLVNGNADAKFMAKRIFEAAENGEDLDVHQMFTEYLMQNHRRTARGAEFIADKWMEKIAQKASTGGLSRRALTAELGRQIYGEGANRMFRFIGRMDTSQLTPANKQALDSLLFRHSALSKIKNTSGISARINKAANALIGARMRSLFWLNFKNGVLQASECIRLFTEFKLGDALSTIKRLATDKEFRTEVDEWVDMLVPERFVKSDSEASIGALVQIADKSSYDGDTLTVNKFSKSELKRMAKSFDEFASAPVEMGEVAKNRVLMAGILQEAERRGLSGNELFSFVNQRFERIGLAANEMGRLNASDNPLFRIGANLKTFQIRQFRMFLNNIHDMNGGKEATTYIIKNLGWKAGLALIMSKLGYSSAATLGLDPFDLMDDDYTGVDEENYTGLDYAMLSPVAKIFLSGGFTGYINDLYWAARKAYEDNATITEETEGRVNKEFWPGVAAPGTSFDDILNTMSGFIPGFTAGKRVLQMNNLMDMGWAISGTGNRMYQAPTSPLDVAAGYAFGRSNTPQGRAYYQTPDYVQGFLNNGLAGVGQQIGREFGGFRQFDPIDSSGYTDWFDGTLADEQQWNSGYYYFLNKVQEMQDEYQKSLQSYTTDQDKEELKASFNRQLADVEAQLDKFVKAYEAKHPEGIDARKSKNLINVLNLYQAVVTDTPEQANERSLGEYQNALYRYSQAGLPAVTSFKRNTEGEVEPVYSPQLRSAIQGEFGLPEEAAAQIRQLYKDKWKDLGKQYRDRLFSTKGTKNKQAIQKEYINIVRQDLDPIVRLYGNNIWGNEDVENIIDDVFNSMIPKYGQSAKSYLKGIYKGYTGQIRYNEKGNTVLTQINQLLDQGKTAQAKALARTLRQRVQENKTSLTRAELERLQKILND